MDKDGESEDGKRQKYKGQKRGTHECFSRRRGKAVSITGKRKIVESLRINWERVEQEMIKIERERG